MNLLLKEIARQIKSWRSEQAWTQASFAKRLKVHQSVISRLENGRHSPSIKSLQRLAKGFGADLSIRFVTKTKSPMNEDVVDKIAGRIYDAHPTCEVHARWIDLVRWTKEPPSEANKWRIDHYKEVVEVRKEEARAVLHFIELYLK